ncbi:MAG: PilN domain-containing protein [Pseudomonadota bacterium]
MTMETREDLFGWLMERLQPRRRLSVFANLVEAGALELLSTPPSRRAPSFVRIVLTGEEPLLELVDGSTVKQTGFDLEAGTARKIRAEGVRSVDLVFADGAVLDVAFTLPEASFAELRQMAFHEIAYQSPFEAHEARWCWTAKRVGSGGTAVWNVNAAIALAERLEPVLVALGDAGIKVNCVRRRSATGADWAALPRWAEELPTSDRPSTAKRRPAVIRWLSAAWQAPLTAAVPILATVGFFGLAGTTYAQLTLESMALSEQTERARAAIAVASRNAVMRRSFEEERLLSALRIAAIGNVAASLPDDTWLASLSIDKDQFEISGFGPSAARTSEDLAQVPGLGALRFAAPIARNSRQQTERFRLTASFGTAATESAE